MSKINSFLGVKNGGGLGIHGSLLILQEIIIMDCYPVGKVCEYFLKERNMKLLSDYLSSPDKSKLEEMRKLEGSNYGIHCIGYYDSVFIFLHRFQVTRW